MNILKSTLESFKENELTNKHKVKVYGGLPVNGLPPQELPLEDFEEDNGDPQNGTGPRSGSSGGSSSATSAASLGNPHGGGIPPIGG